MASSSPKVVPVPYIGVQLLPSPDTWPSRTTNNSRTSDSPIAIKADNDIEAVISFLGEYKESPATLRRFGKETERLLLWLYAKSRAEGRQFTLRDMMLEDIHEYEAFLRNPGETWASTRKVRHFNPDGSLNKEWRPFVKVVNKDGITIKCGLSDTSFNSARGVTKLMFAWLNAAGYLRINPYILRRKRRKENPIEETTAEKAERIRSRYLHKDFREVIVSALNNYPAKKKPKEKVTPREKDRYERDRYVLYLFLYLTLRLSEAASHKMGNFYKNKNGHWFLRVKGKGDKLRMVSANHRFLAALKRYREYLGLPGYPEPDEETALIPSINGESSISDRQVHNIIKNIINNAAAELRKVNKHQAEELQRASAHWFRHTSNTIMVEAGVDRRFRKEHAGHSKDETAAIYEHIEHEDLHQAMQDVDAGLDGLID